ncbi:MAG: hypothetical protein F6K24_34570 [Okeania sp. SIO2D1]|nr:hypothetical protein [Okeania sp. SIO2D1]
MLISNTYFVYNLCSETPARVKIGHKEYTSKLLATYHKTVNLSIYRKMRREKLVIHRQINLGDRF